MPKYRVAMTVQEIRECTVEAPDEKEAMKMAEWSYPSDEVCTKEERREAWFAEEIEEDAKTTT